LHEHVIVAVICVYPSRVSHQL